MIWHPDMPAEYLDQIVTGDARVLAERIPDESVDLIFTDPVYDRIDDYRWLAETAARVLKPTGAVLVWSNGRWHRANANWLESGGLTYRWDFGNVMVGGPQPMNGHIIAKTNRVIWLDRDGASRMCGYLADGLITAHGRDPGPKWDHWGKSARFTSDALLAFTLSGDFVFDPFVGTGTVPAVCKMLGRHYVAFEIDPATAEKARERVTNTQPPIPELVAEQMPLEVAP